MTVLLRWFIPSPPVAFRWLVSADKAELPIPPSTALDLPVIIVPLGGGGRVVGPDFVHVQAVPAATWIINHNLGYRPDFTLFTVGGVQFSAGIDHPTLNQSRITLGVDLAGEAHGR